MVFMKAALILLMLELSHGDVCIPAQHRVYGIEDSKSLFDRQSLSLPSNVTKGFYRSMVLDENVNKLIIGGKNYVAFVDDSSLAVSHLEHWETDDTKCLNEGQVPASSCSNYITHLNVYKDSVVACGTGSNDPVYKVLSLTNYTTISSKKQLGVCASPNPDHRVVGQVTKLGEMIAGTFLDDEGSTSKVVGSYVTEKMTYYRDNLDTRNDKYDIKTHTEFIASFYIKDSVYVFFMEAAEERGDELTATVGRFCQTDNGGQTFISSQLWTTFRKARLNCKYEGANNVAFRNLVDIVYDEKKNLFYATYTMTKHESLASSVCTFSFDEINDSFSKESLEKDVNTKQWKAVNGPKFLIGCEVNKTLLETQGSPTSIGKEPTNNLDLTSSMFLSTHRLMATEIQSRNDIFQFMKPITRFSRITFDRLSGDKSDGNQKTIISVIDENGRIFMLHGPSDGKSTCVIEEIETGINSPKKFIMNEAKRLLYVSSDEDVYSYNVDSCHRYSSQKECIDAHNPRCGWNSVQSQCLSWKNRGNLSLTQNLTHCPKRLGIFSSWSQWRPQQQHNSGRYCLARHRQCRSCDLKLCEVETMEVTNCTSNTVTNIDRWLEEGSVDGSWSEWIGWSECQVSGKCGNNTMIRSRKCSAPLPSNGGRSCIGSDFECTTCPTEVFHMFWSEWENWGECKQNNAKLEQHRTRVCSKPKQCVGAELEARECPPSGVLWGEWTVCSCEQRIQHRYPKFIAGCNNCKKLRKSQYQTCTPLGCPTLEPENNNNKTSNDTKVIDVAPIPHVVPIRNECNDGYSFKLVELVSIGIGIIASCFVIIIVIVVLIIRRDRKKNTSYSPHAIRKTKSQPLLEETDTLESRESNA